MPVRRTEELHRRRLSIAGANYFITGCTAGRQAGLDEFSPAHALLRAAKGSDAAGETGTLAFTVMPDHFHWLFQLGDRLPLGRVVAKLKFQARHGLRMYDLAWQRDFYECRLRADDNPEDYALYIFLNPYRAGLIEPGQACPWWWTGQSQALRFPGLLDAAGSPPAEWIDLPVPESVRHGE